MNRNKSLEELNNEIDVYIQNAKINEKQQMALENMICDLTKQLKTEKLKREVLQNDLKHERLAKQSLVNQLRLPFYYAWSTGDIIDVYVDATSVQFRLQIVGVYDNTATCRMVNSGDVVYVYRNPFGDCGNYQHYVFLMDKTRVWGNILTQKELFRSINC
jgi:hypothetical protein